MSHLTLIETNPIAEIPYVGFERSELSKILSVYSRRVVEGIWRDYAIDQMPGRAVFSIFRNSREAPLFVIVKFGEDRWEIASGMRTLVVAESLVEALELFSRELRIVD